MNSSAVHVALCRMSALGAAPAEEESRALRATFSFRDHHRLTGSPSPPASLSVHQSCATTESTSSFQQPPSQALPSSSPPASRPAPATLSVSPTAAAKVTVSPSNPSSKLESVSKATPAAAAVPKVVISEITLSSSQPPTEVSKMPLPSSTELLDSQIAGHRHGEGRHKLGMLRHKDGSILKPLVPNDSRAGREHEFYLMLERHREMCSKESCDDPVLHQLLEITPRYLGVFEGEFEEGQKISYMKLEDLCEGFEKPCIADIKIGRITHDPLATKEKIARLTNRYPPQMTIGYRLLGMRVFEEDRCHVYSGEFGLEQTEKSVPEAIKTFVAANVDCVPAIVEELRKILQWFKSQQRFTFYSSSILFVYDAAQLKTSVKLIDFAHVFPATAHDDNYIYGLERLFDHFCQSIEKP